MIYKPLWKFGKKYHKIMKFETKLYGILKNIINKILDIIKENKILKEFWDKI